MLHSLIVNSINALLSAYLFFLFARWFTHSRTKIYKVTCFLMLGLTLQYATTAMSYWRCIHGEDFDFIVTSWFVSYNRYFVMIPLVWYCGHVTKRVFWPEPPAMYKRRLTD